MLRLAFDFIITWRETRTRPNAYVLSLILILTFRYYYEHEDKMLDKALIYAKENRNELKKVLKYYKNDKADTPNTLQPVNGMNDFLFASRFYKIAADSSYFRKNTRKH